MKDDHHPKESLSVLLQRLADPRPATEAIDPAEEAAERISIGDLLRLLEGRSAAALLLIFALPNVLPMPPGTSGLLGLPLVYLSWQLMLGRPPWLPKMIGERSVSRKDFRAIVGRVIPFLARAERFMRPRLPELSTVSMVRAVGAMCFLLSVILLLPIPLGNMLPALAISLFALGMLERDGYCILVAAATSVVSLLLVWGVLWAMVKAVFFVFGLGGGD